MSLVSSVSFYFIGVSSISNSPSYIAVYSCFYFLNGFLYLGLFRYKGNFLIYLVDEWTFTSPWTVSDFLIS